MPRNQASTNRASSSGSLSQERAKIKELHRAVLCRVQRDLEQVQLSGSVNQDAETIQGVLTDCLTHAFAIGIPAGDERKYRRAKLLYDLSESESLCRRMGDEDPAVLISGLLGDDEAKLKAADTSRYTGMKSVRDSAWGIITAARGQRHDETCRPQEVQVTSAWQSVKKSFRETARTAAAKRLRDLEALADPRDDRSVKPIQATLGPSDATLCDIAFSVVAVEMTKLFSDMDNVLQIPEDDGRPRTWKDVETLRVWKDGVAKAIEDIRLRTQFLPEYQTFLDPAAASSSTEPITMDTMFVDKEDLYIRYTSLGGSPRPRF